jgi:hypothetical protein
MTKVKCQETDCEHNYNNYCQIQEIELKTVIANETEFEDGRSIYNEYLWCENFSVK